MKKISIILNVFFLLVIGLLVFNPLDYLFEETKAQLTIKNQSNSTIKDLNISLARHDYMYNIKGLAAGGSVTVEFNEFGDSQYVLKGSFENGTKINGSVGYVCSGMNFQDAISITPDGKVNLIPEKEWVEISIFCQVCPEPWGNDENIEYYFKNHGIKIYDKRVKDRLGVCEAKSCPSYYIKEVLIDYDNINKVNNLLNKSKQNNI